MVKSLRKASSHGVPNVLSEVTGPSSPLNSEIVRKVETSMIFLPLK